MHSRGQQRASDYAEIPPRLAADGSSSPLLGGSDRQADNRYGNRRSFRFSPPLRPRRPSGKTLRRALPYLFCFEGCFFLFLPPAHNPVPNPFLSPLPHFIGYYNNYQLFSCPSSLPFVLRSVLSFPPRFSIPPPPAVAVAALSPTQVTRVGAGETKLG